MAFPLCFRTLEHFGKSFKANKMVKSWVSGSLSLFLVLAGFFSANPAFAGSPPTKWAAEGSSSFTHPSYQAACQASFGALTVSPIWQSEGIPFYTVESVFSVYCRQPGFWMNGPHTIKEDKTARVTGQCADGSSPSGSDINNACPQLPTPTPTPTPSYPCRDTLGQPSEGCTGGNCTITNLPLTSSTTSFATRSYCSNSCQFRGDVKHCGNNNIAPEGSPPQCVLMLGVNGCSDTCQLSGVRGTGLACDDTGKPIPDPNLAPPIDTDSAPNSPDPSVTPLPKGKCKGTVNGVEVTVNCVNTTTVDKSDSTKTNADGSTTTTDSKTLCDGKKCTTTTTTTEKDPSGATTSTKTEGQSEDQHNFCTKNPNANACESKGFCEENPQLPICKSGSWASTTCEAVPTCEGDPVQCAQAKQAFKSACETEKLNDAISGQASELPAAKGIVDSALSQGSGNSSLITDTDSVSVGSFDQTNPWGSTCPADRTIAAFEGHNIEFKLSEYCSIFQLMGTLAVAFTLLAAGLFVFKD